VTVPASDTPAGLLSPSQRVQPQQLALDAWGVVFCGGASARMGRDKALLVLDGESLLEHAVRELARVTPRVLLASGSAPRYPALGLECVLDPASGLGPLAGLCAALERLEREGVSHACVLACDMPRARAETFRALLARARTERADVCLVATATGLEPLCGVYHVRALPAVRAALAGGARRMNAFHGAVRLVTVPEHELADGCARNLNTPDEFRAEGGAWA
jgi:molybdopterin-guanine dinucleotide biosynthesis protein A